MGFLISLCFGIFPMLLYAYIIYWLDRYEKEPLQLLGGVFLWGALIAAGGAFLINTTLGLGVYIFTGSEVATQFSTTTLFAPIIEESLKGLAVLFIFLLFRNEFDSILDGIVYAAITALGFAATENSYYIYTMGYLENGLTGLLTLTFIRVILVGWQHPFYTAFIGIGIAVARSSPKPLIWIFAPLLGWLLAILTHAGHNFISAVIPGFPGLAIGTLIDWSGWLMMFIFIVWVTNREAKILKQHLAEEVSAGLITKQQYQIACSSWSQLAARISALFRGEYQKTHRLYQLCAELAHKKAQYHREPTQSTAQIIQSLRHNLHGLSSQ